MNNYYLPQSVFDHYNAHYSNDTYRAFSRALAQVVGYETFDHLNTMNLLTDAALARSGATNWFDGAYERLVVGMSPDLVALADRHLANFNRPPAPTKPQAPTDSLAMESARRTLIKLVIPDLTVDDVLQALEAFNEAQINDLALQMPDRLADRVLAMSEPVSLVLGPMSEREAADLYADDRYGAPLQIDLNVTDGCNAGRASGNG